MIRCCFVPREGRCFAEIDFGSHEFNIAAAVWNDPKMIEYASDPTKDVHQDMAAKVFCIPNEEVTKEQRYLAKSQIVFPKLYGSYYIKMAIRIGEDAVGSFSGWKGHPSKLFTKSGRPVKKCWREAGIFKRGACVQNEPPESGSLEKHIKGIEDWFDSEFSTFSTRKNELWRRYKERGWFDYVTGFRISGIYSRNFFLNARIQGPAFHVLLESMVRISKEFKRRKMKAIIVGTIHDCLLVDCPMNELQDVLNIVQRVMTKDVPRDWDWITVPLKSEVDVAVPGTTWWEKKPWSCEGGTWKPKPK